jgi:hypothetical protein
MIHKLRCGSGGGNSCVLFNARSGVAESETVRGAGNVGRRLVTAATFLTRSVRSSPAKCLKSLTATDQKTVPTAAIAHSLSYETRMTRGVLGQA